MITPASGTGVTMSPGTPPPFTKDVTETPFTEDVTPHPFTKAVTETVTKVINVDNGHMDNGALIGGIVGAVLLLLICIIAVLLWRLSRQKGSYVTNEIDEDDDDIDDNDDESMGSDTALQSREPLKIKEEE